MASIVERDDRYCDRTVESYRRFISLFPYNSKRSFLPLYRVRDMLCTIRRIYHELLKFDMKIRTVEIVYVSEAWYFVEMFSFLQELTLRYVQRSFVRMRLVNASRLFAIGFCRSYFIPFYSNRVLYIVLRRCDKINYTYADTIQYVHSLYSRFRYVSLPH